MDFNLNYGSYGFENKTQFSSLVDQHERTFEVTEKADKNLNEVDSFVSQEMRNPQLDLQTPNCKCVRK